MRKFIVVAALLTGAALLSGSPAKAEVGCQCVKLGSPSLCMAGIAECSKYGGVCLAPCDYKPPMMKKMKHMKKKM
jgi:hypothetical protein